MLPGDCNLSMKRIILNFITKKAKHISNILKTNSLNGSEHCFKRRKT